MGERDVLDYTELAVEYYTSEYLSRVSMGVHRLAGPFLSLPCRMQSHCTPTSRAQASWARPRPGPWGSHVLAIGRRSCGDKTSARAVSEDDDQEHGIVPRLLRRGPRALVIACLWPRAHFSKVFLKCLFFLT